MSAQPPSANRRMPKLPGNAKPRLNPGPVVVPQAPLDRICIEDFVVGPNGIECTDPSWPRPSVYLEDLEKVGRLGSGKQGDVYKYHRKDNINVKYALKIIRLPSGMEADKNNNVVAELRSALGHRINNTVTLENAYVKDGKLVLIMEYMNYGNLRELMEQVKARQVGDSVTGGLPELTMAWIASQVVRALYDMNAPPSDAIGGGLPAGDDKDRKRAHIHRDIKPDNILLTRDGDVKLADFGVATSADSIGASTFVGTVSYMSPERIKGMRHGPPSDVWSLGVVAAEAMLGRFPYPSADAGIFQLMKDIQTTHVSVPCCGADSQAFLDRCLAQESEQRGTASELLNHPWIMRGLDQRDSLKQLIRKCIAKSKPSAAAQQAVAPQAGESTEAVPPPSQMRKVAE